MTKNRFFGAYYNTPAIWMREAFYINSSPAEEKQNWNDMNLDQIDQYNKSSYPLIKFINDYLSLRDITSITPDECKGLFEVLGYYKYSENYNSINITKDGIIITCEDELHSVVIDRNGGLTSDSKKSTIASDYLRGLGIAVSYMGLSVDDLKINGWIKMNYHIWGGSEPISKYVPKIFNRENKNLTEKEQIERLCTIMKEQTEVIKSNTEEGQKLATNILKDLGVIDDNGNRTDKYSSYDLD